MGMYDDVVSGASESIEIGGYSFYAENIDGDEPYNRREYIQKSVLNGTEVTKKGKYIHREYSFTTTLYHPIDRPDAHDKILEKLMSKPVEVKSRYMCGSKGSFNAIVTFTKRIDQSSPNHMAFDVNLVEVPDKNSNIPGESTLKVPAIEKVSVKKTSSDKTKTKINSKTNKALNKKLSKCNVPFRKNQKNACVKYLQEKLIDLGYLDKKYKNGVYDAKTIKAVKSYQSSTNGKLKVDGIFGKYTRSSIVKT